MSELTWFLQSKGFDCIEGKAATAPHTTIFFKDFVMHVPHEGTTIGELYKVRQSHYEEDMKKSRLGDT